MFEAVDGVRSCEVSVPARGRWYRCGVVSGDIEDEAPSVELDRGVECALDV